LKYHYSLQKKLRKNRKFLLIIPVILIASTAFVFFVFSNIFGNDLGYLIGFSFYYFVWCYSIPILMLGKEGFVSLFTEMNPLFTRKNWYLILIFSLLVIGTLMMYLIPVINDATIPLILLALPIAVIHGIGEEALWRGLYVKNFPKNLFLGIIFPTITFALWHLSPQIIYSAENGIFNFLLSTFFLGLSYSIIAYKTGSIKWVALLHIIGSLLALGQPITTSILSVLGI